MTRRAYVRSRLADEEGVSLVIAVLAIAIMTMLAASAIFFTDGSQRDAFSKKSGQTAYSLAQAALSNATAQLTSHYYDNNGQPKDNYSTLADMAAWAPIGAQSQQSPTNTSPCVTTSQISTCMTWQSTLCTNVSATCPAYPNIMPPAGPEAAAWRITAAGTVPNPSGTQPITRTIAVYVPVTAPPTPTSSVPSIFETVYSGGTGQPCDMLVAQGITFRSPVYVVGNLCLENPQAGILDPGTADVGGYVYIQQGSGGSVGTSAAPLSHLAVAGGCSQTQWPTGTCTLTKNGSLCTDGKFIYVDCKGFSNSPTFPPPPDEDFNFVKTHSMPMACSGVESLAFTSTTNSTTQPFNLTPNYGDYQCIMGSIDGSVKFGSISWDHSTNTLTVQGDVYVNADLVTYNGPQVLYKGIGGIFVDGSINFSNNTVFCAAPPAGQGFSGTHDCLGGTNFDTSKDTGSFLMFFAQGGISGANLGLQGGLYSKFGDINFSSGQTNIYGPMITEYGSLIPGQQAGSGYPVLEAVISGWLQGPQPFWQLGSPIGGTY